jgi:hypothetical protein
MNRLLTQLFARGEGGAGTEVTLGHEGLGPGWALLLVILLAAAFFWAYGWGAAGLPKWRRGLLWTLRLLALAVFAVLLTKPVLQLTVHEPIRERLLVLVDGTQSMKIADRRTVDDDKKRAAIAAGESGEKWNGATRADLLNALSTNSKLRLWPRLQEKADLVFYSFADAATQSGTVTATAEVAKDSPTLPEVAELFKKQPYAGESTALGESLLQVLEENRGQPVGGILVVSDGANNAGVPPDEIAARAGQEGLPLYVYGLGITAPKDIFLQEIQGPKGAFMKETAEFTVKIRSSGYRGQALTLVLKSDGKTVKEQPITLTNDGDNEFKIAFEPQEKGTVSIEASVQPRADESATDNNAVSTKLRVLDSKVKVLYLEQEPRWDFRYLLATLRRDRRLDVKCVLFDGDKEVTTEKDSPFLPAFPEDRGAVVENEIIILGDVSPETLGETRMKLINEWVGELGGGLIFLAGRKQNPLRYANTPLEALLPVEVDAGLTPEQWAQRSKAPIPLQLTPVGELSPLLRLEEDPAASRRLWSGFPGVHWTARVLRDRPTAQTLLEDTTPANAGRNGLMPVIAQQAYGQGQVLYFGFDETYRWRSRVGEKYYSRIWNQVFQSFSLERQLGASSRTQLRTENPLYFTGDKVVISGKVLSADFRPLIEPSVPGILRRQPTLDGPITERPLTLAPIPDQQGSYRAEFEAKEPGFYSFSTLIDPQAAVKFEVQDRQIELGETAMNESLLKSMAELSGGKFFREETLDKLPDEIASRSATIPTYKKLELFYNPWWIVTLIGLMCLEWLLRRLWQLR